MFNAHVPRILRTIIEALLKCPEKKYPDLLLP